MKNKTSDLLIQIFTVTLGVFLGFIVSNWSENRKEVRKYNALLNNISTEIKANQKKIEQVVDYHRMVRDSTRYYLRKNEFNTANPKFFRGVNTLTFVNSAYQTGIQTGLLNRMDLQKIQAINDVYTKQRAYEDFANLLLSGLITMDFEDEKAVRRIAAFLSISMTDIVIKEEQLLESIDNALSNLNK